jgi:peptidyl-prolyl cis-trans isomerase D
MLRVLRENVKYLSWILWVIIGLFVLFVFADFGTGVRGRGNVTWVAKVGSETISQSEFQQAYQSMDRRLQQMYGEQYTPEVAKQMQVPLQALNEAVTTKILLREARRAGLSVSDKEVSDEILSSPSFLDDQGHFIGEQRYSQILVQNRLSVAGFEEMVRNDLLKRKLLEALSAGLYVSDAELERTYREQVERAKVRYIEVPRTRFADLVVAPAEVTAWFNAHRQDFRLPEQRQAAYLLVEPAQLINQVKLSDAELQSYYSAHQDEFKQDEQVRASHILLQINDKRTAAEAERQLAEIKQRIEKGEDFGAVARQVSEDPGSKANGGDLGFFSHGHMVKEFEQAAFSAPVGQLVGPIKSPFGYHLLKVTGRHAGGVQPLAEVRPQIQSRLAFDRARALAESKAKELAARLAKDKPTSAAALAALAKDNPGVTSADTGKFSQQGAVAGLGLAQQLNAVVFAAKKGDVTGAVEVPRGWAIALVEDVFPAHLAELTEVEPKVRQQLTNQRQQEKVIELLSRDKGKPLDAVAAELGTQVKESPELSANGSIPGIGAVPQLVKQAMTLQPGQVGGPVPDSRGAVLFQVTERKSWDPAKFAAARDQTRQSIQQQKLQSLISALLERRKRDLGVDYNSRLLTSLGISLDGQQPQIG